MNMAYAEYAGNRIPSCLVGAMLCASRIRLATEGEP